MKRLLNRVGISATGFDGPVRGRDYQMKNIEYSCTVMQCQNRNGTWFPPVITLGDGKSFHAQDAGLVAVCFLLAIVTASMWQLDAGKTDWGEV